MDAFRHPHLSSEFEGEMNDLRAKLLLMASKVEGNIAAVTEALVKRESDKAESVIVRDKEVDSLEKEVDELCIRILALRQPTASDLRHITTALKVVTDLERMGDLCVNIAKCTIEINREPRLKPYIDIPSMAHAAGDMVRRSLDAFVREDPSLAKQVVVADKEVDRLNKQLFRDLLTFMIDSPSTIGVSTHLLFVARHLERIADHATNIAEQVIFMVMGDDVRHEKAKLRAQVQEEAARRAEAESDTEGAPPDLRSAPPSGS
jgi:phosphate transport system protein